jgi:signal transduction histidine kinase
MVTDGEIEKNLSRIDSAEEEIRLRKEEYKILHEISKILHETGELKEMLTKVMTSLTHFEELKVEHKAGIFLADEEKRVLRLFSTIGKFSEEFLEKEKEIPYGNCLCGRVAASGEMIISKSCFTDNRHENKFKGMTAHGHYIIPLQSQGRMVGVLFLYTDENPPWYVRSQEILISIGGLLAEGILSRQREEQIRNNNENLKKINDLKNKFLGIASHDLRNPLFIIQSFSEVIKDASVGDINAKQKDLLEKIYNASKFMSALLDNLLDVSKIESGKIDLDRKVQDLNLTAKQQVELNQLLAEKKSIKLTLSLADIPPLSYDHNAIIQVMGNFIGNAIKFSPSNTEIIIATECVENDIRFSVCDEGPGLSEEDQKLLFKEFQVLSAKPTGGEKSTGLGLAIVKKLVHLHSGRVGAYSNKGAGSTFFFTLPSQ